MAYDEELAVRIRSLLATEVGVDEVPLLGGLAFLINGNMAVAVSGKGGIMVHVPPEETKTLLEYPHTAPMYMSARETLGWLRVFEEGIITDRQLTRWVTIGSDYARKLPPK
ncbi:TfoX/Sxy family protein [Gordonia westfalica]|uniref:TfoX/Sxy family protein n=1 Tax=Gordonia westfalica TaxID=158898 RepID=A0ABU2GPB4_9ACTN|nr:TfoX/Sxy family protein [Gordonia westfalica]MDS1113287.1 TfoX/Sxy family protein [Gordonia westfalica]